MYMPQNGLMGFLKEHCIKDLSCFYDILLIDHYCFLGILNSRMARLHCISKDFTFIQFFLPMFLSIPLKIQVHVEKNASSKKNFNPLCATS
jgi:hypothetical protein